MFLALVFEDREELVDAQRDSNLKIKKVVELNSKFFLVLDLEKLRDVKISVKYATNVKLVVVKPEFTIHKHAELRIMSFSSFVGDDLLPLKIYEGGFFSEEWIKDYILVDPDQQFFLINVTSKEYQGRIINQMVDARDIAFDWDDEELYDVRSYPSHNPRIKNLICFDQEIKELFKNNK